eukprot:scaffold15176_cov102-Isochrysis_galbana.AAC.3
MDVSVRAVRQPVLSFLILLSFVSCLLRLPIAFERNGSADADADHGLSAGAAQELARNSVRVLATARWWSPAPRSFLTHRPRRVRLEYGLWAPTSKVKEFSIAEGKCNSPPRVIEIVPTKLLN